MKTVDLSILLLVYHRVLSIFVYVLSLKAGSAGFTARKDGGLLKVSGFQAFIVSLGETHATHVSMVMSTQLWRITMLFMGRITISTGPCSSSQYKLLEAI